VTMLVPVPAEVRGVFGVLLGKTFVRHVDGVIGETHLWSAPVLRPPRTDAEATSAMACALVARVHAATRRFIAEGVRTPGEAALLVEAWIASQEDLLEEALALLDRRPDWTALSVEAVTAPDAACERALWEAWVARALTDGASWSRVERNRPLEDRAAVDPGAIPVLLDWQQEHGDPAGLLAVTLRAGDHGRGYLLRLRHARRLLGALAPFAGTGQLQWRDGLLRGVVLDHAYFAPHTGETLRALLALPAGRFLERILLRRLDDEAARELLRADLRHPGLVFLGRFSEDLAAQLRTLTTKEKDR
jgi:hypothetical protein